MILRYEKLEVSLVFDIIRCRIYESVGILKISRTLKWRFVIMNEKKALILSHLPRDEADGGILLADAGADVVDLRRRATAFDANSSVARVADDSNATNAVASFADGNVETKVAEFERSFEGASQADQLPAVCH